MWLSAYHFNCDRTELDIATMHCMTDAQLSEGISWYYECAHTGFGKGLQSVETWVGQIYDTEVTPATLDTFTTTGTLRTYELLNSFDMWAMAVLITSTVS